MTLRRILGRERLTAVRPRCLEYSVPHKVPLAGQRARRDDSRTSGLERRTRTMVSWCFHLLAVAQPAPPLSFPPRRLLQRLAVVGSHIAGELSLERGCWAMEEGIRSPLWPRNNQSAAGKRFWAMVKTCLGRKRNVLVEGFVIFNMGRSEAQAGSWQLRAFAASGRMHSTYGVNDHDNPESTDIRC